MQMQRSSNTALTGPDERSKREEHRLPLKGSLNGSSTKENHMTIVDYLTRYDASLFEFLPSPVPAFKPEQLWMDLQEARLGLAPQFGPNGQRVYHKLLIGWCMDVEIPAKPTE